MSADRKALMRLYGPNGLFIQGSWKEDSDRLFSPQDARGVYHNLLKSGCIPPFNERFVFVSPSANIPTHEYAIWKADNRLRQAPNLFIAADIQSLILPSHYRYATYGDKTFHSVTLDARSLPTEPIQPKSVDLLWDRKGAIWHAVYLQSNPDQAWKLIKGYQECLKLGGSIVVDNIADFSWERLLHFDQDKEQQAVRDFELGKPPKYRPRDIVVGSLRQYERSTVDLIDRNMPRLWGLLEDDFYIKVVGGGKFRVLALTKKAA